LYGLPFWASLSRCLPIASDPSIVRRAARCFGCLDYRYGRRCGETCARRGYHAEMTPIAIILIIYILPMDPPHPTPPEGLPVIPSWHPCRARRRPAWSALAQTRLPTRAGPHVGGSARAVNALFCRQARSSGRASCMSHRKGFGRGWRCTRSEQVDFPPVSGDRDPSSCNTLPDLPSDRCLPARQPQRGPDRALPQGPSRNARPPCPIAVSQTSTTCPLRDEPC
jgi:hypothetical protein